MLPWKKLVSGWENEQIFPSIGEASFPEEASEIYRKNLRMAKLIFIGEKFGGRVYEFAVAKTTVGRGDHNTLTIHDASVSQSHCEIFNYNEDVIVRDLGSSNGTFVNGERLHNQQRPLKAGQTVKFGSVEARLELERPHSADPGTEMTAIHSIGRHHDKPPDAPKEPTLFEITLEADLKGAATDHTVMLPRPSEAEKPNSPPAPGKLHSPKKPFNKAAFALIVAGSVVVVALMLWLIWGKG